MKTIFFIFSMLLVHTFGFAQCSNPPQVTIRSDYDTINCYHSSTTLHSDIISGTAPFAFEWKVGGSVYGTDSILQNVQYAALYTLKLTDANGCIAKDSIQLIDRYYNYYNPRFASDITVSCSCCTKVFDSLATPNLHYTWSNNSTGQRQDTAIICGAGIYTVTVSDINNGCALTTTVQVRSGTEVAWQQGVECVLLQATNGGAWFYNVNYPFGMGWVPRGEPLNITFRDTFAASFCMQGRDIFIECADVMYGTTSTTTPNQAVQIGDTGNPNAVYRWFPNVGLPIMSNNNTAQISVTPTENSIFIRRQYSDPNCIADSCLSYPTYYNVHVLRPSTSCVVLTNTSSGTEKVERVQVFPNPASNDLTLRYSNFENKQIIITDVLGRTQSQQYLQNETTNIDIQNLPNGIYFLSMYEKNHLVGNSKFVVQHD
jgi:Secretion system C-terminal sorting domain